MDDRWEKEVSEFGAINITGFRVLDFSRKVVRDFIDVWKKDSVSVSIIIKNVFICGGVSATIRSMG